MACEISPAVVITFLWIQTRRERDTLKPWKTLRKTEIGFENISNSDLSSKALHLKEQGNSSLAEDF